MVRTRGKREMRGGQAARGMQAGLGCCQSDVAILSESSASSDDSLVELSARGDFICPGSNRRCHQLQMEAGVQMKHVCHVIA